MIRRQRQPQTSARRGRRGGRRRGGGRGRAARSRPGWPCARLHGAGTSRRLQGRVWTGCRARPRGEAGGKRGRRARFVGGAASIAAARPPRAAAALPAALNARAAGRGARARGARPRPRAGRCAREATTRTASVRTGGACTANVSSRLRSQVEPILRVAERRRESARGGAARRRARPRATWGEAGGNRVPRRRLRPTWPPRAGRQARERAGDRADGGPALDSLGWQP